MRGRPPNATGHSVKQGERNTMPLGRVKQKEESRKEMVKGEYSTKTGAQNDGDAGGSREPT